VSYLSFALIDCISRKDKGKKDLMYKYPERKDSVHVQWSDVSFTVLPPQHKHTFFRVGPTSNTLGRCSSWAKKNHTYEL